MTHDLRIERLMDVTLEEAYDAFLEADAIKDWYQQQPTWNVEVVAHDATVGGTTVVEFGDPGVGWTCREDMTYTELDRPRRIAYRQTFTSAMGDESGSYDTVVAVTFENQDGKTLLTLVETGYPDASERDAHQNGWPGFLEKLEHVAKARTLR